MIWPAHILIRHRDVPPGLVSFTLPLWKGAPPPPERTRRAAHELAESIATRLHAGPAQFAELARQYSEDIATRAAGGALGGVSAFKLSDWPEALDALAALQPGEVSRVVETGYGFHVLLLRPPPEARQVSGAHIVIGYDEAPWLHRFLARRPIPTRSRAEAEALARRVYEEALAAPGDFPRLVDQYSEQYDADMGGDFGQWSTLEPTPYPDAVEALQHLQPGEVAPPLDSPFGFQIVMRARERARERYGEAVIQHAYSPVAADGELLSRSSVLRTMRGVQQTLRAEPNRFAEFQARYCCAGLQTWSEGRGPPREEPVVRRLALGEVASDLIEWNQRFLIVRRDAPEEQGLRLASVGLPSPDAPDVAFFFEMFGGPDTWRAFGQVAADLAGLSTEQRTRLREIHDDDLEHLDLARSHPNVSGRRVAFEERQSQVRGVLGAEQYARYMRALQQQVEQRLLAPPSAS